MTLKLLNKDDKLYNYGRIRHHRTITKKATMKRSEQLFKSTCDSQILCTTSHSAERTTIASKRHSKENKEYNAKKLVYPSVRRLKTWMSKSVCEDPVQNKQLRKILYDHINKNMRHMNLKVSGEIERPSVTKLSTQNYPMKLPQIQKLRSEFKKIKTNHRKVGIMRRNKLLLEHIMHERIRKQPDFRPGVQNFRTKVSVN